MDNKDQDDQQINEEEQFEVQSKLISQPKPPPAVPLKHTSSTHTEMMTEAAKKHYEPLPWTNFFDELTYTDDVTANLLKGTSIFRAGENGVAFFCIHGAGHSAMSFALLAKEVKHFGTLLAFDFKGHGASKNLQNVQDMSIETLINETIQILKYQMQKYSNKNFVLIGHSLGGSVCARVTDILTNKQHDDRIVGMIIIDVVEGTAIEALPFMNQILKDRPKRFDTLESAVKWSIQSAALRKVESARVSIPAQLKEVEHKGSKKFAWKVNLSETEKYWHDWFKDLSSIFLSVKIPKILVTAEKERLDKELTIAQMQGKFKLMILHGVGHSVQQDDYKGTARMLYDFMKDFRIPQTLSQVNYKKQVGIPNFHPQLLHY